MSEYLVILLHHSLKLIFDSDYIFFSHTHRQQRFCRSTQRGAAVRVCVQDLRDRPPVQRVPRPREPCQAGAAGAFPSLRASVYTGTAGG